MSTERMIETKAADGGRMTYADVREWVTEMARAGASDGTPVEARVSLGGGLKSLKAKAGDVPPQGTVVTQVGLN